MLAVPGRVASVALWAALLTAAGQLAAADPLTIYQIQHTTEPDGASPFHDEIVDCTGGIVVAKFAGFRPRLILQHPMYPDEWGGIQAKDWIYPYQMFTDAQIGDWVSFTNMYVEDFRGTTMLQRQSAYNPGYIIVSQGNPLPPPIIVSVADIPAPLEYSGYEWRVENHDAERFESMRLIVRDVVVTDMDLGKAADNYDIANPQGESCWASDYMNEDIGPDDYHPFVMLDAHFCAIAGVFEQYMKWSSDEPPELLWDYYQLLTLTTVDLAICGDGDSDGLVYVADLPRLADCLCGPYCDDLPAGCDQPAWTWDPLSLPVQHCLMMDLDYDGDVDLHDAAEWQTAFDPP